MLIILSIIVILFAGFTQGLTSFGFALISMPLLSKLVPLQEAVPLVVKHERFAYFPVGFIGGLLNGVRKYG